MSRNQALAQNQEVAFRQPDPRWVVSLADVRPLNDPDMVVGKS